MCGSDGMAFKPDGPLLHFERLQRSVALWDAGYAFYVPGHCHVN